MDATHFLIIGTVYEGPELVQLSNFEMLKFIVTSETWYKGNRKEYYHEIVAFGEKRIEYLEDKVKKGARIKVSGTLGGRPYDGNDGKTRYSGSLKADSVATYFKPKAQKNEPEEEEGDGLPF